MKVSPAMSGLKVRIDGQGNVDTAHLGKQLEQKAKDKVSNFIWGLVIGGIILGLIVVLFVGIGVYAYFQAKNIGNSATGGSAGGAPTAAVWDGKSEYTCMGNDNVVLDGVTANLTSGTAITLMGNCHLTLKKCHITAPIAIDAGGNSQVTVEGGDVKGTDSAIKAGGLAKVTVNGAKVTGKVDKAGGATVTGVK